ncbi:MAG: pyridoxal-phosphate dependent enzyme [Candidatus Heimdallarchaeota archaeon]|nr:MAG: pyridoxal-phosphate dependent enzyme [Candidatus Heimdallarchaeota archaeon]
MATFSSPPLFEEYPSLKGSIPWISLVDSPTPVRRLTNLEEYLETDISLWVKEDSLTSSKYGGNKVRKLEFIIADALQKEKNTIATIGGIGTNHGLATTIFGKDHDLKTVLYLIKQPITNHVLNNLKLDYYYGAELRYVKNYIGIGLNFYFLDRLRRKQTYWLSAGGSTPLGVLGYVNAVFELKKQIEKGTLPEPESIFVAAGTTGTMAGLELGIQLNGLRTRVFGVRVTDRMAATAGKVRSLGKKALKILRQDPKLRQLRYRPNFQLIDKFYGGAYGRVTKEASEAVNVIKETEGLSLETTYTGKALAGLFEHVKQRKIKGSIDDEPKSVLFWNTYNSVNLSSIADQVNYKQLPSEFHHLFN